MTDARSRGADASPSPGVLLDLVSDLDADNERLRLRLLEMGRWMEDAVTALVAQERRSAELEAQVAAVERELTAIRASLTWRAAEPFRRVYSRVRRS